MLLVIIYSKYTQRRIGPRTSLDCVSMRESDQCPVCSIDCDSGIGLLSLFSQNRNINCTTTFLIYTLKGSRSFSVNRRVRFTTLNSVGNSKRDRRGKAFGCMADTLLDRIDGDNKSEQGLTSGRLGRVLTSGDDVPYEIHVATCNCRACCSGTVCVPATSLLQRVGGPELG